MIERWKSGRGALSCAAIALLLASTGLMSTARSAPVASSPPIEACVVGPDGLPLADALVVANWNIVGHRPRVIHNVEGMERFDRAPVVIHFRLQGQDIVLIPSGAPGDWARATGQHLHAMPDAPMQTGRRPDETRSSAWPGDVKSIDRRALANDAR